jgi:hypothetical protein
VVALLRLRRVGVQPEVREGEREGCIGVRSTAAGCVVADHGVIDAKQLSTRAGRWLHGEDDIRGLPGVEAEEQDLELATHVRLIVDPAVERDTVDLDRAVGAGRVPWRGRGERPEPDGGDPARRDGGENRH